MLADIPVEDVLRWGWMATGQQRGMGQRRRVHDRRAACPARPRRRRARTAAALPLRAGHSAWVGDFAGAASNMAEADSVAASTGSVSMPWTALRLRALQEGSRGRRSDSERDRASRSRSAPWRRRALGGRSAVQRPLPLRQGRSVSPAATSNRFEYWVSVWVLPELVEASASGRHHRRARGARAAAETTQPSANDFALGIEARCRALLSDGAAANDLYREAIERLGRTELRPELCSGASAVRGVAAPGRTARRRARAAAYGARHARDDRHGGIRRARATRTARHRRRSANAATTCATNSPRRRSRSPGSRVTGCRTGDRRATVPQCSHRRVASRKVFTKLGISSRKQLRETLPDRATLPATV